MQPTNMNNTTITTEGSFFIYDIFLDVIWILYILFGTLSMILLVIIMYILSRKVKDCIFNRLLIMMSIFDFVYVISCLIFAIFYFVGLSNIPGAFYFINFLLPLAFASLYGSTLSNASMCIDRCIGMFRPFAYRANNLSVNLRRKTLCYYLFPILIITAVMTTQNLDHVELDNLGNIKWKDLNPQIVETIVSAAVVILITISTMVLYYHMKISRRGVGSSQERKSELEILFMLICMMVLDWIGPIVVIVYQILMEDENEECLGGYLQKCSPSMPYLIYITNLIPCVTPALNFVVLSKFGTRFREALVEVMMSVIEKLSCCITNVSHKGNAASVEVTKNSYLSSS